LHAPEDPDVAWRAGTATRSKALNCSRRTSYPDTLAVPDVGGSRVVSILITVVLPAPLVPSNPKICLPAIVTCTELTAVTEPKQRVSATVSTAGRSAVGGLRESPFGSEAGVKTSGIDTVR
jgi:hypothetical protein